MKFISILFVVFFSVIHPVSAEDRGRCYRIPVESPGAESDDIAREETWCYQKLSELSGGQYIFNADEERVRPELALVLENDGTMTHGSLMADKLTMHRVRASDFNPYSIPLKEPEGLRFAPPASVRATPESARVALDLLLSHRGTRAVTEPELSTGDELSVAASAFKPWRGYWWPAKGRPLQRGPLAKFDHFVQARTGNNPRSVAAEDRKHAYNGVWWEGHCNGWAAASVLRNEPRSSRSGSGITFNASDLKGLLAETDYCASVAFFGNRNRGDGNGGGDIRPHLFHKTLRYYIGSLGKPVAMDYRADSPVDNHVVSAYSMDMVSTGSNSLRVTATLTVHKYDLSNTNSIGPAPQYTRVYRYNLRTDNNGNAVGGSWISGNPDFLWVPLSPRDCGSNNPNLDRGWVNTILNL